MTPTQRQRWQRNLRERRKARRYWLSIPEKKIKLHKVLFDLKARKPDNDLTPGWQHHCNSVGCLAWLATMPSVVKVRRRRPRQWGWEIFEAVSRVLGIDRSEDNTHDYFAGRRLNNLSQKQEGLERIDQMIAYAKAKLRREMTR